MLDDKSRGNGRLGSAGVGAPVPRSERSGIPHRNNSSIFGKVTTTMRFLGQPIFHRIALSCVCNDTRIPPYFGSASEAPHLTSYLQCYPAIPYANGISNSKKEIQCPESQPETGALTTPGSQSALVLNVVVGYPSVTVSAILASLSDKTVAVKSTDLT